MANALIPHDSRRNPFDTPDARVGGSCVAWTGDHIERVPDASEPVPALVDFVHESFRALVLNPRFSCVGAKAAVHAGAYRFGVYEDMASPAATAALARDLFDFVESRRAAASGFATFIAAFTGPPIASETDFERALWGQLRALHALDRAHHAWDPSVSADPESAQFSFSFAESAFFVVGLHAGSSRFTRRFAWPTLVFNPHAQFDKLREEGKFKAFRDTIRAREVELQGTIHPELKDHGESSEARQYSGRAVEPEWRCPFPHAEDENE